MDTAGKSALKLGNLTNFKVDTSKASKDIAPQSLEILQTFVFKDYSRVKAKSWWCWIITDKKSRGLFNNINWA